jgi:cytochrome c oxidase cbb3-type subunit 3
MIRTRRTVQLLAGAAFAVALGAGVGAQRPSPPRQRPVPRGATPATKPAGADTGEATARRLCSLCHPFENIVAIRRTRAQWEATVENMISRGARGTSAEFATVVDYLSAAYALEGSTVRGAAGPDDKPLVDPKASEIAKPLWTSDCQLCHGADARGTDRGPNLVRSALVLGDRYGSTIGPYLRTKHAALPSGKKIELTDTQVLLLAHFLRDRVNDTLRGSPLFKPGDILVGDAKAGAAYFDGEGRCGQCHSPSGDLKGIATRLDPVGMQQRLLFPSNAGARRRTTAAPVVTVTVTRENGETIAGELVHMDDFYVSLRDASGAYRTVRRAPGVRVEKHDPFAAHVDLLSRITDTQIHDLVAYLETLK